MSVHHTHKKIHMHARERIIYPTCIYIFKSKER